MLVVTYVRRTVIKKVNCFRRLFIKKKRRNKVFRSVLLPLKRVKLELFYLAILLSLWIEGERRVKKNINVCIAVRSTTGMR